MKDRSKLTPYQKCLRIYSKLEAKSGPIDGSDYKWRLGSSAMSQIKEMSTRIYPEELSEDDTMYVTLFGLKIDRAINDPDCVEIWKNITHKFI